MAEPTFEGDLMDADDVADYIVEEFAAENNGVAEVIPSGEIRTHLDDVVVNAGEIDGQEWETFVVDVKDAVLRRDVIIA